MSLKKEDYRERLIDDKIAKYLKIFGAICIEGPKWCGKTWTSLNHSNSVTYMTEKSSRELAKVDPKYIFTEERPQLIDEWQLVPSIWDSVRNECDMDHNKGKFILTGSTSLLKDNEENEVYHTGTGRIASIKMYTMSLFESGDSTGDVSITDIVNNCVKEKHLKKTELPYLAKLIIRGGFPENISVQDEDIGIIPHSYLESIIDKDIHERKDKKRDSNKMRMLIRTLARNESSTASINTIIKDISDNSDIDGKIENRITVSDYLGVLQDLYLLNNIEAFSTNYRSSKRVGKTSKRHFIDPSLACASLDLSVDKLMRDLNTFGLMFESLVIRDLTIYMNYLDGRVFHFRDNSSGDEVDAILEFKDGSYGAVEIKLTEEGIESAKASLVKFYNNVEKKPLFMCIIVGHYEAIIKDPKTGIYILPITALKA